MEEKFYSRNRHTVGKSLGFGEVPTPKNLTQPRPKRHFLDQTASFQPLCVTLWSLRQLDRPAHPIDRDTINKHLKRYDNDIVDTCDVIITEPNVTTNIFVTFRELRDVINRVTFGSTFSKLQAFKVCGLPQER